MPFLKDLVHHAIGLATDHSQHLLSLSKLHFLPFWFSFRAIYPKELVLLKLVFKLNFTLVQSNKSINLKPNLSENTSIDYISSHIRYPTTSQLVIHDQVALQFEVHTHFQIHFLSKRIFARMRSKWPYSNNNLPQEEIQIMLNKFLLRLEMSFRVRKVEMVDRWAEEVTIGSNIYWGQI